MATLTFSTSDPAEGSGWIGAGSAPIHTEGAAFTHGGGRPRPPSSTRDIR
jgi:hypothetical protein